MYVRFHIREDCSDIYEVPDNTTDEELDEQAGEWFENNGYCDWEIVDEDEVHNK